MVPCRKRSTTIERDERDEYLWTKNCRVGKPVVVGDMGLSWKRIVIVGDGEWAGVVAGSGSTDLGTAWCKEEMVSSSGVGLIYIFAVKVGCHIRVDNVP